MINFELKNTVYLKITNCILIQILNLFLDITYFESSQDCIFLKPEKPFKTSAIIVNEVEKFDIIFYNNFCTISKNTQKITIVNYTLLL